MRALAAALVDPRVHPGARSLAAGHTWAAAAERTWRCVLG